MSAEVDTSLSVHSPAPAAPAASTLETSALPTIETSAAPTVETPAVPTLETPADPTKATLARTVSSNSAVDSAVEIPVAEDVIRTCVTPGKYSGFGKHSKKKQIGTDAQLTFFPSFSRRKKS